MGLFSSLAAGVRRQFNARSLTVQTAVAGACAAALAGGLAWRWSAIATSAAVAGALLATLPAVWLAWRADQAARAVAAAARAVRRDEAGDEPDIPLVDTSAELQQMALDLRRMVDAARRRKRELEALNAALTRRLEARTHELSTLQDLSIGLATTSDLFELVDEALGALEQTMDYASASLWSRNAREAGAQVVLLGYRVGEGADARGTEDLTGMRLSRANLQHYEQIEREREPIIENNARQSLLSWLWEKVIDDARSSALYRASRSWMAVPLKFRDEVLGVMRVDHETPEYFDPEHARLLLAVSSQTALAMRHSQLLAQERDVAVMAERNRIARDLHDAVSQTLFAANVLAGTLAGTLEREPPPERQGVLDQVRALERLSRGALAEMRLLMLELRPDAMQAMSVADLLQQAIEAVGCRGEVTIAQALAREDALAPGQRVHLYRIAQEALANIARHSGAEHVEIEWTTGPGARATLRIADDGAGFDPDLPCPGHFGLSNMRSRAQEIGAVLTIMSAPGQGTQLRVELGAETENRTSDEH